VNITTLKATDLDSGPNGKVYYSLIAGDPYGEFFLDNTGTIGQ